MSLLDSVDLPPDEHPRPIAALVMLTVGVRVISPPVDEHRHEKAGSTCAGSLFLGSPAIAAEQNLSFTVAQDPALSRTEAGPLHEHTFALHIHNIGESTVEWITGIEVRRSAMFAKDVALSISTTAGATWSPRFAGAAANRGPTFCAVPPLVPAATQDLLVRVAHIPQTEEPLASSAMHFTFDVTTTQSVKNPHRLRQSRRWRFLPGGRE